MRKKQKEKADQGDIHAKGELTRVKQRQKELTARKDEALMVIEREPQLILPGEITFVAHALVVPSNDPEDRQRYDADVEAVLSHGLAEGGGANGDDVHEGSKGVDDELAGGGDDGLHGSGPGQREKALQGWVRCSLAGNNLTFFTT